MPDLPASGWNMLILIWVITSSNRRKDSDGASRLYTETIVSPIFFWDPNMRRVLTGNPYFAHQESAVALAVADLFYGATRRTPSMHACRRLPNLVQIRCAWHHRSELAQRCKTHLRPQRGTAADGSCRPTTSSSFRPNSTGTRGA